MSAARVSFCGVGGGVGSGWARAEAGRSTVNVQAASRKRVWTPGNATVASAEALQECARQNHACESLAPASDWGCSISTPRRPRPMGLLSGRCRRATRVRVTPGESLPAARPDCDPRLNSEIVAPQGERPSSTAHCSDLVETTSRGASGSRVPSWCCEPSEQRVPC